MEYKGLPEVSGWCAVQCIESWLAVGRPDHQGLRHGCKEGVIQLNSHVWRLHLLQKHEDTLGGWREFPPTAHSLNCVPMMLCHEHCGAMQVQSLSPLTPVHVVETEEQKFAVR